MLGNLSARQLAVISERDKPERGRSRKMNIKRALLGEESLKKDPLQIAIPVMGVKVSNSESLLLPYSREEDEGLNGLSYLHIRTQLLASYMG
ncbi:hypothetical protein IF2G_06771 [Cordyceps javanica]|nr:hypothetical protein IF2G_06771 [Cordyceps javanica]